MLDHEPLFRAEKAGRILPLYIIEPDLWTQPDVSYRHYHHLQHYLKQLDAMFKCKGGNLVVKVGEALSVFKYLTEKYNVKTIYSHYETWNKFSKDRDEAIRKWTEKNSVDWKEYQQNGVVRKLRTRDGWSTLWHSYMRKETRTVPEDFHCVADNCDLLPSFQELQLDFDGFEPNTNFGEIEPDVVLESFLNQRGENYQKEMSGPQLSEHSCSRLSTHIAYGTISIRTIFQRAQERAKKRGLNLGRFEESLKSYNEELHKKTINGLKKIGDLE